MLSASILGIAVIVSLLLLGLLVIQEPLVVGGRCAGLVHTVV